MLLRISRTLNNLWIMKIQSYLGCLLAIIFVISSCAPIQPLTNKTLNQAELNIQLRKDDKIKVTKKDGSKMDMIIDAVEESYLLGHSKKEDILIVPYDLIDDIKIYKSLYKITVKKSDKSKFSGLLWSVEENKITVIESYDIQDYQLQQIPIIEVYAHEIEKLKLRKKGGIGRGVGNGASIGFATGALLGLISGSDSCDPNKICLFETSAEDKALGGGIFFGLVGGAVGAIINAIPKSVTINSSMDQFKSNQTRLKGYSYR